MRALFLLPLLLLAGAADAQPSLSPPKTVWDSDVDGTALHRISTLQCPMASGPFRRFNIQLFDKVGFDVGCDYRTDGSEITLYLTKIDPAEFDQHFEVARKGAAERFPDTRSRDATLPLPPGFEWRRASFLLPNGMFSDVLMAPFHGWYFEIRVSYRAEKADVTAQALAELSALALKTAGQHLAACEARPSAKADGQRVMDKDTLRSRAIIAGALMGKIMINGELRLLPAPPADRLSCADGNFSLGNDNFVFWRDTSANGPTVERITGIERSFTATTREMLADLMAQLSAEKDPASGNGGLGMGVVVLVDRGEDWDVMAFFEGAPGMKDMAEAALLGRPLARVNKAGNTVTIFTEPAGK